MKKTKLHYDSCEQDKSKKPLVRSSINTKSTVFCYKQNPCTQTCDNCFDNAKTVLETLGFKVERIKKKNQDTPST